jgi:hypothetical protein
VKSQSSTIMVGSLDQDSVDHIVACQKALRAIDEATEDLKRMQPSVYEERGLRQL